MQKRTHIARDPADERFVHLARGVEVRHALVVEPAYSNRRSTSSHWIESSLDSATKLTPSGSQPTNDL
jgi:hypothetical protein